MPTGTLAKIAVAVADAAALGAVDADARATYRRAPAGSFYAEGATHRAPGGMLRLCVARPELCPELRTRAEVSKILRRIAAPVAMTKITLTREAYETLVAVNRAVNDSIRGYDERGDVWTLSATSGDCEEYAIMKREALVALGWPRVALRIAIGKTDRGENHAVLIARTTSGDIVLDNLTDDLLTVGRTRHTLRAVESSETPGKWVRLELRGAPRLATSDVGRRSLR